MIDANFVIFDVETTDPHAGALLGGTPEIIEIGAVLVNRSWQVLNEYSQLIRPERMDFVTEFTSQLSGLRPEMLEESPTFEEMWKSWAEFTRYKSFRLFSWGGTDIHQLRHAYSSVRLGYPHNDMPIDIASMVYMWGSTRGWNPKGLGLASVCKELGITIQGHHRAMADAHLALQVLKHMFNSEEEDEEVQIYAV